MPGRSEPGGRRSKRKATGGSIAHRLPLCHADQGNIYRLYVSMEMEAYNRGNGARFPWKENQMKHWSETLAQVVGHVRRILLCGEPGTGKTSYAFKLATDKAKAVERVTLCAGMFSDALLGKYLLRDGSTVWCDGPAVRAMRNGGVLLLDEIADAGPEIQSTLRAILDDENVCCITLDNGERVKPKSGFCIIATMNGQVESLLPALLDRFDVVLAHCDSPNPGIADSIKNAGVSAYIRNSAENADDKSSEWKPAITTRRLIAFSRLSVAIDAVDAAEIVFGAAQAESLLHAFVDAERNKGKTKAKA